MTFDQPPRYLLQNPLDLRHLTRRDVLEQLADAAMHRDWAVSLTLERLPRSALEFDYDMRIVFSTLWGRLINQRWDDQDNDVACVALLASAEWLTSYPDRLGRQADVHDWFEEIGSWYSPETRNPLYVEALLDALHEEDELVAISACELQNRLYGGPLAVDETLEDLVYERLREAVSRRRGLRLARAAGHLPAPAPEPNWDRVLERANR